MGCLRYGSNGLSVDVEDRLLAHLKSVIIAKLKRDEKFTFSWVTAPGADGRPGRCTIWLHPAIELHFVFDDAERPMLNRRWIDQLSQLANTSDGLSSLPEPG